MGVRLLLALLIAAFAVPVAAPAGAVMPCHDAGMAAMTMPAAATPAAHHAPDRHVPPHGCIGCIPPSAWTPATLDARAPSRAPAPRVGEARAMRGARGAPALPPPRIA